MSDTVVDTCCLVNLCAVDDPARFLPRLGLLWHIPRAVADEGIYIRTEKDGGRAEKRKIELAPCFAAKVVHACDVQGSEEAGLYVELARFLDDGEAMALAIAKVRGWKLATDDRQGRKKAGELAVPVFTTPQLMRLWAERNRITSSDLAIALLRIQRLARFVPSSDFPEHSWWKDAVE